MTARSLYLGAISGTSVDGIDLALVNIQQRPEILAWDTVPFDNQMTQSLKELGQGRQDDLDRLGHYDAAFGELLGEAVNQFLKDNNLDSTQIVALGCHGQTVRHRPFADLPFTLQIGDPNRIAEITGLTTVADFRRRDIAAGGQGAPLVPGFHRALFSSPAENRSILNIGGIANITNLPQTSLQQALSGFDTGPGNALLDSWVMRHLQQTFDRDGAWAATGDKLPSLVNTWLKDPYFNLPPPKSTGREYFNLEWLERGQDLSQYRPQDIQASLLELTAHSIADAVSRWGLADGPVIVCGGGRLNSQLMISLAQRLPGHSLEPCENYQQNGDVIEAAAFAWLAYCRLQSTPANEPTVTGARGNRVLGAIYAP